MQYPHHTTVTVNCPVLLTFDRIKFI